jgi:hypothetical protein
MDAWRPPPRLADLNAILEGVRQCESKSMSMSALRHFTTFTGNA